MGGGGNSAANNDNAYRVDGGRERHAADDDQQIAERQVEYVYVGHVSHMLVPEEYQHQRAVADGPDDEYDGEQCGHDVSLRPVGVIVTDGRRRRHTAAVVVRRVVVVGRHGVHAVRLHCNNIYPAIGAVDARQTIIIIFSPALVPFRSSYYPLLLETTGRGFCLGEVPTTASVFDIALENKNITIFRHLFARRDYH